MSTASWRPDPENPAQLRWHDGTNWTDHTHANTAEESVVASSTAPATAVQFVTGVAPAAIYSVPAADPRPSAKGMAIASMVLGIVGLVLGFFCWPVGIICCCVGLPLGWVARNRTAQPQYSDAGRGQATAGMVMTLIGLGFALIGMLFIGGLVSAITSGG